MKDGTLAILAKVLRNSEVSSLLKAIEGSLPPNRKIRWLPLSERVSIKHQLEQTLKQQSFPLHLADVLVNFIDEEESDYPLSPTISLEVAGQAVGENETFLLITKDGELVDKPEISIKVHASVSIDELVDFIKANRQFIEESMSVLKLPQIPTVSRWKKIRLALRIIEMKEIEKLSFTKISTELSTAEDLSQDEIEYLSSESNIKTLYYRYTKYLSE